MRLTRRGVGTLAVATALVALGLVAGYPLLVALGAIAVGAVAAAVGVVGRRPRVAVTRELSPDRVERGGRADISLRVHNPGTRRQAAFTAVDRVGADQVRITVRPLPAGTEQSYSDPLPTGRRGRHEVGPLTLHRVDALGLARSERTFGGTATLWVYPRTHPVRVVADGPPPHHDGTATEISPRGSVDVRAVRAYVPGDEVRHLHWKATARTGQLMIRDHADPYQPRFTVLLDDRRGHATSAEFEEAVEFAASLVVAATFADHRCQLVTPSGVDVATLPGVRAVQRYLDQLCVVTQAEDGGLPLVPSELTRAGGGRLVVVSSSVTRNDRAALGAVRPRYGEVVVVTVNGSAPEISGVRVLSTVSAFDALRQWQAVIAR